MGTCFLGSKAFRLDPTRISWSYAVKTSERDTLGGRVVQVFGAEISDITVAVTFGTGGRGAGRRGWIEQAEWLSYLVGLSAAQATGTLPPAQFRYPGLGIDFRCYLKGVAQPEGDSVTLANEIIAPTWVLTLVVLDDDKGTLTPLKEASVIGYLDRLADGVGWKQTSYNGPMTRAELVAAIGGDSDAAAQVFLARSGEPVAAAALDALSKIVLAAQTSQATAVPADPNAPGGATSNVPNVPAVPNAGYTGAATDWGPGWPACRKSEMRRGRGGGISIEMHGALTELTCILLDKTVAMGYPVKQASTGGFVCRAIGGTSKPSNHSRGTAIDINWNDNGFGVNVPHDIPNGVAQMWKNYGFGWGGDWRGKKDWMHFEFNGPPSAAASQTARIKSGG